MSADERGAREPMIDGGDNVILTGTETPRTSEPPTEHD